MHNVLTDSAHSPRTTTLEDKASRLLRDHRKGVFADEVVRAISTAERYPFSPDTLIGRVTYWAPQSGGYVRTGNRQVCDGLAQTGQTLYWDGAAPLVNLIRKEHRRAQRWERRHYR